MATGDALPKVVPTSQTIHTSALKNPYTCSRGHILGTIGSEYDKRLRSRRARLFLFRRAYIPGEFIPTSAVFAKIDDGEVMCGICGDIKVWTPNPRRSK